MPSDYGLIEPKDEMEQVSVPETPTTGTNDVIRRSMQGYPQDTAEADSSSYQPDADDKGTYDWVDRGMQDTPVDDLPWPEDVNGPEDFNHHITYDDAISATRQLEEIQPSVNRGYTSDDFARLDSEQGLDYSRGQQRIYDLYYGSDPIRLDRDGEDYDIVSGRHRVYAAKVCGLTTVPAHVTEKVVR
jgi:hypothetical protein